VWGEIQKRVDGLITDLHRHFARNSDKILPLKTLVRCLELIPDREGASLQEVNEQMQVKLMSMILREFRKNREYTKHREQKRFADSQAKEKLLAHEAKKGKSATTSGGMMRQQPKQGS
jgi:hypothetical protein